MYFILFLVLLFLSLFFFCFAVSQNNSDYTGLGFVFLLFSVGLGLFLVGRKYTNATFGANKSPSIAKVGPVNAEIKELEDAVEQVIEGVAGLEPENVLIVRNTQEQMGEMNPQQLERFHEVIKHIRGENGSQGIYEWIRDMYHTRIPLIHTLFNRGESKVNITATEEMFQNTAKPKGKKSRTTKSHSYPNLNASIKPVHQEDTEEEEQEESVGYVTRVGNAIEAVRNSRLVASARENAPIANAKLGEGARIAHTHFRQMFTSMGSVMKTLADNAKERMKERPLIQDERAAQGEEKRIVPSHPIHEDKSTVRSDHPEYKPFDIRERFTLISSDPIPSPPFFTSRMPKTDQKGPTPPIKAGVKSKDTRRRNSKHVREGLIPLEPPVNITTGSFLGDYTHEYHNFTTTVMSLINMQQAAIQELLRGTDPASKRRLLHKGNG